jgi:hypothetical protein
MTGWGVFSRRQTPPLLSKSQDYKPYLRLDFLRRCAYCRVKEYPEDNQFHFEWTTSAPRAEINLPTLTAFTAICTTPVIGVTTPRETTGPARRSN